MNAATCACNLEIRDLLVMTCLYIWVVSEVHCPVAPTMRKLGHGERPHVDAQADCQEQLTDTWVKISPASPLTNKSFQLNRTEQNWTAPLCLASILNPWNPLVEENGYFTPLNYGLFCYTAIISLWDSKDRSELWKKDNIIFGVKWHYLFSNSRQPSSQWTWCIGQLSNKNSH